MPYYPRFTPSFWAALAFCAFSTPLSAETWIDDSYILGNLCVGADCVVDDDLDFDTLRLHAPSPRILFEDTSNTMSFPTNDWSLGIEPTDDNTATRFIVRDVSADTLVMQLEAEASGGIALGANAEIVSGAVSVGGAGSERRIVHVADAIEPTDAVNLRQFNDFQLAFTDQIADADSELALVDSEIEALEDQLQSLNTRLNTLTDQLGN
ncbi:hypothetical protein [Halopseudomonas salegens]|uniref:Coiled stalk of trimeric autotransporter adhesin n=1 Tax=Halopseudomonas salegens TaxID=1434072 RepID=A0A1H2EPV8_9GAMM|nr:hypothetical protein [Halopseudomonas salegens]SDT97084.1 Coiled stalk of trimeric autotransporter adhesin [Halopseudomonas salegens]